MTLYLYVKTHNITGLKYLGKTSRNPFEYKGSGKFWVRHLAKHGNDITTEIIYETTDDNLQLLREYGIYYSNLFDVVKSKQWANIVTEQGDGGDTSSSENYKKYITSVEAQKFNAINGAMLGKKSKGKTVVVDNQGKKFRVPIDDPRLQTGELVGHTIGKMFALDNDGNKHYIDKNDPRFKSGELKSNNKGKIHITDGTNRKFIYPGDIIPNGWYVGDIKQLCSRGRIWINNKIEEKMIFSVDGIPSEWQKGRIISGKLGRKKKNLL